MTISTSTSRAGPYAGAGTTGPFAVPFRFLENSHLKVVQTTSAGVETTLVLSLGYTVTGAGLVTGGSVTTVVAVPVGDTITIVRDVPYTQETDYTQSDPFPAQSHEDALDKLTMLAQQLKSSVDRSLRVPEQIVLPDLPTIAARANRVLAFDASGNPTATVGVDASSATALQLALAGKTTTATGAGMIGYRRTNAYLAETVGAKLNDLPYTPTDGLLAGDGVTDDTVKLNALLASGPVDLGNKTYAVSAKIRFSNAIRSTGATLKFTANVANGVEIGNNAVNHDKITFDFSTITCARPVIYSGAEQSTQFNAPKFNYVTLRGNNHTATGPALSLDATIAGAGNQSWCQYAEFEHWTVHNCNAPGELKADNTTLGLSYVNANKLNWWTVVGCKNNWLLNAAGSAAECSSNDFFGYKLQFGAVLGSFPVNEVKTTGICKSNRFYGFYFDWDPSNVSTPIVDFGASSESNIILTSAFRRQCRDAGVRNIIESLQEPARSSLWASQFGQNFLGEQDNVLAHWAPSIGTLTSSTSSTGTAACNLATGALTDMQKENGSFAGIAFAAGTGVASFNIDFTSTTLLINELSVVGVCFEAGFLPQQMEVWINNGSGFVLRASFSEIWTPEFFIKLDKVSGTDVYNNVSAVRVVIKGSDTRTVRVRNICANGIGPRTYPSRGGDRYNGDLVFVPGVGPCIRSPDTTLWRITVSNAGALAAVAAPSPTVTYP